MTKTLIVSVGLKEQLQLACLSNVSFEVEVGGDVSSSRTALPSVMKATTSSGSVGRRTGWRAWLLSKFQCSVGLGWAWVELCEQETLEVVNLKGP